MNSLILKLTAQPTWTEEYPEPENWMQQGGDYVLTLDSELLSYPPVAAANPTVIGEWDPATGTPIGTVNEAEYLALRPLGNDPDGRATQALLPPWWQGVPQPRVASGRYYPVAFVPYPLEFRHKQFPSGDWGWRAEVFLAVDDDSMAQRPPTLRGIGVYSDNLYETRIDVVQPPTPQDSEWYVDENGDPVQTWAIESSAQMLRPAKDVWYLAVVKGNTKEGTVVLPADLEGGLQRYFWAVDRTDGV